MFNLKTCFLASYVLSLLLQSSSGITWAPRSIPTLGVSKKSWLFLFERWEGNALLWAARWNNKSPWQPCNRWNINVIKMLFIWNKQSIADVAKWTFLAKDPTKRFIFKIKSSVGNSFDLHCFFVTCRLHLYIYMLYLLYRKFLLATHDASVNW